MNISATGKAKLLLSDRRGGRVPRRPLYSMPVINLPVPVVRVVLTPV